MFWSVIHIAALGYSDEPSYAEKRAAKEFYNAFVYMLPCPICRDHLGEILKVIPVDSWLDNRKSLTEWTWMLHNQVNQKLGKSAITQEQFFQRYREVADRGLPIPPATPTAELHDSALQAAWVRGATHTVGGLLAVGAIGTLLWYSYKTR